VHEGECHGGTHRLAPLLYVNNYNKKSLKGQVSLALTPSVMRDRAFCPVTLLPCCPRFMKPKHRTRQSPWSWRLYSLCPLCMTSFDLIHLLCFSLVSLPLVQTLGMSGKGIASSTWDLLRASTLCVFSTQKPDPHCKHLNLLCHSPQSLPVTLGTKSDDISMTWKVPQHQTPVHLS
jgi:hypothetical protein